jgi:drug/metabolite transporter (DMT)-like permease
MVEFFDNLKDWQKGGLGGAIIGVAIVLYALLSSKNTNISNGFVLLSIFSLILPSTYGTINGYVFSKVKNLTQLKKWTIFLGSLLVSSLIFFLIGWILLIKIAKPY